MPRWQYDRYHLICQKQHRLDSKLATAEVKEVLQTGTEQLHDHDIVVTLNAEPFDLGNALYTCQGRGVNTERMT
jgi:hypothetical protein